MNFTMITGDKSQLSWLYPHAYNMQEIFLNSDKEKNDRDRDWMRHPSYT